MQKEHLAIALVPVQQWGPVYNDKEALNTGTIFKELDKPFFAAPVESGVEKADEVPKTEEQKKREELMSRITEVSFVLDDLVLYLDTHAQDQKAMQMYLKKAQERDRLKQEFAEAFYPLTRDCVIYCKDEGKFCWLEGPMPWEGACV